MSNLPINRSHPQAQGLVGFWPCNAIPGRANDPYNLKSTTKSGTVSLINSPIGPAFLFDGGGANTGIIDTQTLLTDIVGNSFTITAQIYLTGRATSYIASSRLDSTSGFFLCIGADDKVLYRIYKTGTFYEIVSTNALSFNKLYTISALCNYNATANTSTMSVYVDGSLQSSQPSFSGTHVESNNTIKIGNSLAVNSAMRGYLSNVRIYNQIKSAKEIQEIVLNPQAIYQQHKPIRVMPSASAPVNTSNFFQMF